LKANEMQFPLQHHMYRFNRSQVRSPKFIFDLKLLRRWILKNC